MPVTCAHLSVSSFSQHFVHRLFSIQRLQARSKYIHVCSSAPSLAHKACTRYTERPNLRCWLSVLRITLFICHFRYNACRHAASTSMYAQLRHPWRTGLYTLYRKAELALLALSTLKPYVRLALSIQRLQARSKYIHVCSTAPSLAHRPVHVIPKGRTCAAGS